MKKILICIFILFTSIIGCSIRYQHDNIKPGLSIAYNSVKKDAFIGTYTWDGNENNMIIDIPDEYKNCKVTSFGGFFGRGVPTSFKVEIPHDLYTEIWDPEDGIPQNTIAYHDLVFEVRIGKNICNIKKCSNLYYANKKDDGTYLVYRILFNYTCSEENETFYSENGKLYYKDNNSLVNICRL